MAHRRILTAGQRRALFDLPTDEGDCRRRYALGEDDLQRIRRRHKPENRLGFALQLCALRFPGRLLKPGEVIPEAMLPSSPIRSTPICATSKATGCGRTPASP